MVLLVMEMVSKWTVYKGDSHQCVFYVHHYNDNVLLFFTSLYFYALCMTECKDARACQTDVINIVRTSFSSSCRYRAALHMRLHARAASASSFTAGFEK